MPSRKGDTGRHRSQGYSRCAIQWDKLTTMHGAILFPHSPSLYFDQGARARIAYRHLELDGPGVYVDMLVSRQME